MNKGRVQIMITFIAFIIGVVSVAAVSGTSSLVSNGNHGSPLTGVAGFPGVPVHLLAQDFSDTPGKPSTCDAAQGGFEYVVPAGQALLITDFVSYSRSVDGPQDSMGLWTDVRDFLFVS